ncbi:TfoX/Sxy family protein [Buchananella felis]|uniref:TfoX/Sxy family protein n=1 Tax=Buchananella felis TaxID=3231492 RepID=UPI00352839C1
MSSTKEYLDYVLDLLRGLDGVAHRRMMREYVIYLRGKVVGGIYDDRFMLKPTKTALELLPDARMELPYEGGKPMILVDVEDSAVVARLVAAVHDDLPSPKKTARPRA